MKAPPGLAPGGAFFMSIFTASNEETKRDMALSDVEGGPDAGL
tara:strand:+ start:186 stop:314 length:129 start_codon:yes stop_codon:yes gene_type:complete